MVLGFLGFAGFASLGLWVLSGLCLVSRLRFGLPFEILRVLFIDLGCDLLWVGTILGFWVYGFRGLLC